ncbi:MAG: RluA family pseudouridine synthase [Spirochaetota bacterium]
MHTEKKLENNKTNEYEYYSFTADQHESGVRLDVFLSSKLEHLSRSCIQKYIEDSRELVRVNAKKTKPHYRLKPDDLVKIWVPPPREPTLKSSKIPLDILYEDDAIIVINKQPGMPVHPAPGHQEDTIVNALIYHFKEKKKLSNLGGENRPGIVHRLDKDTSGLLVVARNNAAHEHISRQFSERNIHKSYQAMVKGKLEPPQGSIHKRIGRDRRHRKKFTTGHTGREATTHYRVIDSREDTSWVEFIPETGRTHQIRVHASSIGCPIIGDPVYARKSAQAEGMMLVAKKLTMVHPGTGRSMTFTAPYPSHFVRYAKSLGYDLNFL